MDDLTAPCGAAFRRGDDENVRGLGFQTEAGEAAGFRLKGGYLALELAHRVGATGRSFHGHAECVRRMHTAWRGHQGVGRSVIGIGD